MDINILVLLGACAIGLSLGLMGSGGSILSVPVLVYLADQPEKVAIAGSLVIVGSIALVGSLSCMRQNLVAWRTVVIFGAPSMMGTYAGAGLSVYLSGVAQLVIFAGVMLLASYFMLRQYKTLTDVPQKNILQYGERDVFKIVTDGFLVGIVTGIVGVGGGFLIVPALVLLCGLTMRVAIATSLVIIALKSFSGFVKYLDVLEQTGLAIDWQIVGVMIVVGALGSTFGGRIANRVSHDKLKKMFGVFLSIMGTYILASSAPQLL